MKIYAGNLSRDVSEQDLRELFEPFGKVESITLIKDKFSGASKGFGFVELPDKAQADAAIAALHGKEVKGRTINVNEARPREERGPGQQGGGGGGNRRGGGGYW